MSDEIVGYLERGEFLYYPSLSGPEEEEVGYSTCDLVQIDGVDADVMRAFLEQHSEEISLCEIIADTTVVVQLLPKLAPSRRSLSRALYKGHRPCIKSTTEAHPPPGGMSWFHFDTMEQHIEVCAAIDWLYDQLGQTTSTLDIALVVNLNPYKLVRVLSRREIKLWHSDLKCIECRLSPDY